MENILFYFFSIGAITSGFLVITANNPINSVLALVLTFANISCILIEFNIEFLGLLFLIVYVGAIAILFLFVIMMLDLKLVELYENTTKYIPLGFFIGILLLLELSTIAKDTTNIEILNKEVLLNTNLVTNTNLEMIGQYLYTDGYDLFLVSGMILLVSMVGAIVLTLYHELDVKRQDIFSQVATEFDKTVQLRKNVIN